ncbi:glycerol-3-phosphate 1-O-acyltransferase PlsY [Solemya velum gill symbiont]|uniref:Glycerol-3-phosphate acyltransferase n=1 Tax=Solemya velum gill symbiont TaxID=2340 RepID=A0A0B0H994_SOVGS|nr:glycerol-3-phosphate 1-O-acyltransferase PlsY [Solemya velum gill symbiont]KHF24409.1 G3P-acyltransferase [Solemya velum gill symbiont]OOY34903.1 glycerol-3-phosphate acyltransferase [Solemya velum gill symbiont]OOY37344.1 glycerol-3-phosphate acyltransferase [Solemya velum gill symbiont]OOY39236.1 glycerol-3-phosphate acyltransferase [Solemya velum gill symbiont]OOY43694.1 glycerol-3-phosphate acyltransferase [Solemya velum gill symbiont]
MPEITLFALLLILAGYLVGSISSAIIVCRLMGLPDPREQGSKNPGATNVLRLGGKKAAAITLAGDWLKGLLPVLAAKMLEQPLDVIALVGLAAFLGHLYPIFFGFKGGKGVATALGVLFGFSLLTGLGVVAVWLVMALLFRYSSLAALTAMAMAPVIVYLQWNNAFLTACQTLITVILFWRHRTNIERLLNGTEGKIGQKG